MDGWIEQRIHKMMDGLNDIEQLIDVMMDDRQIKQINEQWMDGTNNGWTDRTHDTYAEQLMDR